MSIPEGLSLTEAEAFYEGVLRGIRLGLSCSHKSEAEQGLHYYESKLGEIRSARRNQNQIKEMETKDES